MKKIILVLLLVVVFCSLNSKEKWRLERKVEECESISGIPIDVELYITDGERIVMGITLKETSGRERIFSFNPSRSDLVAMQNFRRSVELKMLIEKYKREGKLIQVNIFKNGTIEMLDNHGNSILNL